MTQIARLEVHGIKDYGDKAVIVSDAYADFYGLFGLVEGEENAFYVPIGDYADRHSAELAKELLDNKKPGHTTV